MQVGHLGMGHDGSGRKRGIEADPQRSPRRQDGQAMQSEGEMRVDEGPFHHPPYTSFPLPSLPSLTQVGWGLWYGAGRCIAVPHPTRRDPTSPSHMGGGGELGGRGTT